MPRSRRSNAGAASMVGVNRLRGQRAEAPWVFQIDPEIEREQVERVCALRAGRSETEWRAALAAVEAAARAGDNLVPAIIDRGREARDTR